MCVSNLGMSTLKWYGSQFELWVVSTSKKLKQFSHKGNTKYNFRDKAELKSASTDFKTEEKIASKRTEKLILVHAILSLRKVITSECSIILV